MLQPEPSDKPRYSNGKVAVFCGVVFAAMIGAGFAAVPLYRMFCQATGFDGTIGQAVAAPNQILDQDVTVRFDTNTRNGLPWTFTADQNSQIVRVGETKMAHFKVTNTSDKPITGQATFNILPETAGAYFKKLECFCFQEQTLQPGETMDFPVVYFVDPEFAKDTETRDMSELTLSYSFFPSVNGDIDEGS